MSIILPLVVGHVSTSSDSQTKLVDSKVVRLLIAGLKVWDRFVMNLIFSVSFQLTGMLYVRAGAKLAYCEW